MSSSIEWTNETWNPTVGCTRVSAGCDNCYAVRHTRRLAGSLPIYEGLVNPGKGHFNGTVRTLPERLSIPLRWKKPRLVFVDSMSDLFHPSVPFDFLDRVFAVMALADRHTFQILTKRPARMATYFESKVLRIPEVSLDGAQRLLGIDGDGGTVPWPLPNVWLGTSVESQDVNDRILDLVRVPAAVRFLSCEPLLGPLSIGLLGTVPKTIRDWYTIVAELIGWVIVGGESGPGHRPMDPEWARAIRDECVEAGVPFFFKQWGGRTAKAGGRELDGRTWDEMPDRHDAGVS